MPKGNKPWSRNPKAIVTGGSGFIGRHLCEYLIEQGLEVVNYDITRVREMESNKKYLHRLEDVSKDTLKIRSRDSNNAQYFFHLAGIAHIIPSVENPAIYHKANVTGTFNALQIARQLPH